MRKIVVSFLASIGFLVILSFVGCFFFIQNIFHNPFSAAKDIGNNLILNVKVGTAPFVDVNSDKDLLALVSKGQSASLFETVTAIKHAADDVRVKGVLLNLEGANITLAHAQELREALTFVKEKGKKIYAFAYSFGEGSGGTNLYYLATIADKIFMQPQGGLEITGYAIDGYFIRDLLDKYKIKPQLDRRENYKGVIETFTQKDFSPETRENLGNLLNDMMRQVRGTIANTLKIDATAAQELIDKAPYVDTDALTKKLITNLLHKNEVKELFNAEESSNFITVKNYHKQIAKPKNAPKIALVSVSGEINSPSAAPFQGQNASQRIGNDLEAAGSDSEIKAIILRIDSPGGTVTGAETIWYEVNRIANVFKKPIVVSMGTLAASAGYQIAAPATKIIANPGTITGSIGVATGKIAVGDAAAEFGINLRQIQTAKNAGMWSMAKEFTPDEWEKVQSSLDHYYEIFLKKVSDGRHLGYQKVKDIAKGQVWTGKQAKDIGLVDELGGFLTAIKVAKNLVDISETTPVEIKIIREESFIDSILENLFAGMTESINFIATISHHFKTITGKNSAVEAKLEFMPR